MNKLSDFKSDTRKFLNESNIDDLRKRIAKERFTRGEVESYSSLSLRSSTWGYDLPFGDYYIALLNDEVTNNMCYFLCSKSSSEPLRRLDGYVDLCSGKFLFPHSLFSCQNELFVEFLVYESSDDTVCYLAPKLVSLFTGIPVETGYIVRDSHLFYICDIRFDLSCICTEEGVHNYNDLIKYKSTGYRLTSSSGAVVDFDSTIESCGFIFKRLI